MGYTIYLGNTNKRKNSTARPDYSGWAVFDFLLKGEIDLDTPTVTIYTTSSSTFPDWNYAYITDTQSYYWINSITAVRNDVYEIGLQIDFLATYKSDITSTSGFIMYGNNTDVSGANYRFADGRVPLSNNPTIQYQASSPFDWWDSNVGCYMISAVGRSGGVASYLLSDAQLKIIVNKVSQDIGDQLAGATQEDILRLLTVNTLMQDGAISSIRTVLWLPALLTQLTSNLERGTIYLGDWDTGVQGYKIDRPTISKSTTISIPWGDVSDWKRTRCQVSLHLPVVGTITLPINQIINQSALAVRGVLDLYTGDLSYTVTAYNDTIVLFEGTTNIASQTAIGSSNVPVRNTIGGALDVVTGGINATIGLATEAINPMGGGLGDALSGAGQVVAGIDQMITPQIQCCGNMTGGSAVQGLDIISVTVYYYPPINEQGFETLYGHPVMQVATPVGGYCQTSGFSVKTTARSWIAYAINGMMDRGVYIE